jgi:thiamine pyrophosphokinase
MTQALVFCGGGPIRVPLPTLDDPLVIAADMGAAEALRLGWHVNVLVGDLDSVAPEHVASIAAAGGEIERHPRDKDATDLELALDRALASHAAHVLVAGGDGGRLDMVLANALLLGSDRWRGVALDAVFGGARLTVVRTRRDLAGAPGELVTLLPVGGAASEVRTSGLRWALRGEDLDAGSTRGVSNEFAETAASVEIARGTLVAVQPGDGR